MSSASNFFLGGVLPGLGAAFMAFVIIYTLAKRTRSTGSSSASASGSRRVGLVLSFVAQRIGKSTFYSDPTTSYGDRVEEELAGPQDS